MYLNYFKSEEMTQGDNEPIGIILTKEKEKILVEYALGGITNKLFVSKYQLYLPEKKLLEAEVRKLLNTDKSQINYDEKTDSGVVDVVFSSWYDGC